MKVLLYSGYFSAIALQISFARVAFMAKCSMDEMPIDQTLDSF